MRLVDKGNVVILPVITTLDLDAERVLDGAVNAKLQSCLVIGYDPDGEFYFASTMVDRGSMLWLMEVAKKELMKAI